VYIQCLWQADQSHIDPRVALIVNVKSVSTDVAYCCRRICAFILLLGV
jgi:hypothetical protein